MGPTAGGTRCPDAIRRQPVLGPGHPDTLAAHYRLAEWLSEDGRTDEAEAAYQDVVTTGTEHLGDDHNLVLIARSSLTILRYDRTLPPTARPLTT